MSWKPSCATSSSSTVHSLRSVSKNTASPPVSRKSSPGRCSSIPHPSPAGNSRTVRKLRSVRKLPGRPAADTRAPRPHSGDTSVRRQPASTLWAAPGRRASPAGASSAAGAQTGTHTGAVPRCRSCRTQSDTGCGAVSGWRRASHSWDTAGAESGDRPSRARVAPPTSPAWRDTWNTGG